MLLAKSRKMQANDHDNQIEFAVRLLNERERLEENEVEQWLAKPENRALLDELTRIRQGLEKREYHALKRKEWKNIQKQIRPVGLHIVRRWMSAVAILVLGLGIGLWFGRPEETVLTLKGQQGEKDQIVPGKEQARLILADGREVALGKKMPPSKFIGRLKLPMIRSMD